MSVRKIHKVVTYLVAALWLGNGLFCKVLNLVPRHQQIIARILGDEYAGAFTLLIGVSEILMATWILSGIKTRMNAALQITIVAAMNIIEFILVPDLLLWGRFNSIFAMMLIVLIYYNEFILNKKLVKQT